MRRHRQSGVTIFAAVAAVVVLLALQLKLDFHWGARALAFKRRALSSLEKNLDQHGHALTTDDIRELRETVFSETRSGDEIAAGLKLLSRSDKDDARRTLLDFVIDGPTVAIPERKSLQLLALDGVIAQAKRSRDTSALEKIKTESHDSEISKRAARALSESELTK